MGEAIGEVITLGVAVAFSPLPIIGVVAILATPQGRGNAVAFALAGAASVAVIAGLAVMLMNAAGADDGSGGDPGTWVSVGRLVLAGLLLWFAARSWQGRRKPGEPEKPPPAWLEAVDRMTARRAARMGVVLCGLNPKNLILILGAAAAIAQSGAGTRDQAAALAVFVALAMLGVAVPLGASLLFGDRATHFLESLRAWMVRESATIITVVAVLIAAKLIGDAVGELT